MYSLFICLFNNWYIFIYSFTYLSIYLSVYISTYLPTYLSIHYICVWGGGGGLWVYYHIIAEVCTFALMNIMGIILGLKIEEISE